MVGFIALTAITVLAFVQPVLALDVPPAPSLATPIVDTTNTLSLGQIEQLSTQIAQSCEQKSYQIGILIIPTLGNNEYLEGYSIKVAREWGIGEKETDNGVLVLVVKDDRKMRIEVGDGLQGDLTDLRAGRIVRDVMRPKFQQNDFYGGLSGAIDSIQLAVSQQPDPRLDESSESPVMSFDAIVVLLFIGSALFSWIGAALARTKSWWAGGVIGAIVGSVVLFIFGWVIWAIFTFFLATILGLLLDYLVSRNYRQHSAHGTSPSWWAGGNWLGGGRSGGHSGGGFGGGGFSGGGSSGGW